MTLTFKPHSTQRLLAAGRELLFAVSLLMPCWALAANLQEAAGAPPTELASVWSVVLFLVVFFGTIIGFFVYLAHTWRKDEAKRKQGD